MINYHFRSSINLFLSYINESDSLHLHNILGSYSGSYCDLWKYSIYNTNNNIADIINTFVKFILAIYYLKKQYILKINITFLKIIQSSY